MMTNIITPPLRPARRGSGASRWLDDLTRRIGTLWGVEPQVSPVLRQQLIEEHHQLDVDVERLVLKLSADSTVAIDELQSCQQRYLWLRERWAAPPSSEGWAA